MALNWLKCITFKLNRILNWNFGFWLYSWVNYVTWPFWPNLTKFLAKFWPNLAKFWSKFSKTKKWHIWGPKMLNFKFWKIWPIWTNFGIWPTSKFGPMGQIFQNLKLGHFGPQICQFLVFENFDQNLAKFGQNLVKNLVKFGQNGHVKSDGY